MPHQGVLRQKEIELTQPLSELKQYISANPRNKLAFCLHEIEGFEFVDIGYELSTSISIRLSNRNLPMLAYDKLQKILNKSICNHYECGRYIAIKNIGILFEPALQIDIKNIIEQYSKNQLLLIQNASVPFQQEFRLRSNNSEYSLNISEYKYIIIHSL